MLSQNQQPPKLSDEQIKQKRRQRILQRAAKQSASQQSTSELVQQTQNSNQSKTQSTEYNNYQQTASVSNHNEQDAFQRYRSLRIKEQKQVFDKFQTNQLQNALQMFAKIVGFVVVSIQIYMLSVIKKYQNQYQSGQIRAETFNKIRENLLDQISVVFWACFGVLVFSWALVKFNTKSSNKSGKGNQNGDTIVNSLNSIQIKPGTTMISLMEQLNQILEYKVLLKMLFGYVCTVVVLGLVINCAIVYFQWDESFYKLPIRIQSQTTGHIADQIL